ncbi:ribosome maturation factor RimM [Thermohalobacter berrensis]|uniref:Ribosome maturation factor RimM n=1 Tax=Thermohalobacter berrensis TaxID=99594 RepID=A0A419TAB3_9FIRM|nr:ribosome maturation factor RimM [Thermohalobacter berrensis]RKD34411.1 16S rRNA processing protein RimM [Thermohalobacter berrensis]
MTDYIQIGKIVNTHGIKGELKVIPLTDDIERFEKLDTIFIEKEEDEFQVKKVWYKKNFVILKLKGYNNINDVLKFKNRFILIHKDDAIELPEDSYFIFEIKGLDVYHINGEKIGKVVDVLQPGANDVYVVKNGNKEYLIPAVKEFIKEINLEEGKIVIDPIEGMIE